MSTENARKGRVLIVDDSPMNITLLSEILKGYELMTATSGEEALGLLARERPDLVLLDIVMDGIDGHETCRQIRANPDLSFTKIFMVSARSSIEERLRGYQSGADDYIARPFNHAELLAKVGASLKLKSVEELDALKSDFIRLLAKSTRNPLSGIMAAIELIDGGDPSCDEVRSVLGSAAEGAEALLRLTDQVDTLCSLQAGAAQMELQPVEIQNVVTEALAELEAQVAARSVKLETRIPADAVVNADVSWLARAVRTLVHNAVRFSPEGEVVTIEAAARGACLSLFVEDRGPGVPEASRNVIFDGVGQERDRFGLSLAIARRVAISHGGDLVLGGPATGGAGAQFVLSLPLAVPASTDA